MAEIPCFQVDAFTARAFAGNPAAVCPLDSWLPAPLMQQIAAENNLSETAFFVPRAGAPGEWELRWFTPEIEIDLCGHATLATGFVLARELGFAGERMRFHTRSGALDVTRAGDGFALDFPARPPAPCPVPPALARALGFEARETLRARDLLAVLPDAATVRGLAPDFAAIAALPDTFAVIVTAPGEPGSGVDFVSRFFAPAKGVAEDPVTGSAHCTLTPFWAARLGKSRLRAHQVSRRGGELDCELRGDRVIMSGGAVLVKRGTFLLPERATD